jgi:Rod binding domain-containing protein
MNLSSLPMTPITPPGGDASLLAEQSHSRDPRLVEKVAGGFESMFASMLIKQLRESPGSEGMFGGDRGDVLGGMFDYFLGQHMASAGGLGIAAMVKKQLLQTPRPQ